MMVSFKLSGPKIDKIIMIKRKLKDESIKEIWLMSRDLS